MPPTGATRVLIINDDAHARELLRKVIISFGCEVGIAEDDAAGLATFQARRFDAVITDLAMLGLDGLQVAAALRRLDAAVPVLLLTGSADVAAVDDARRSTPTVLHKPIMLPAFQTAFHAALGGA